MSYNYLHNINFSEKLVEGIKRIAFEQIRDLPKNTKTTRMVTKNITKLTMENKKNGLLKTFGNSSLDNIFSDLNIDRLENGV